MADAERGGYAVGYFESWNLESLLAVADAAEALRSPVILGFSGIYLPDSARRLVRDPLAAYARMAEAVARGLSVPACLLFNESPFLDWVEAAIAEGFGLVMYTDENLAPEELEQRVAGLVRKAHAAGVAVEGEMEPLPGVGGELDAMPEHLHLSDLARSREEEARLRQTVVGPHRDDLDLFVDGMSAQIFASEGQQRGFALALKIGQAQRFARKLNPE